MQAKHVYCLWPGIHLFKGEIISYCPFSGTLDCGIKGGRTDTKGICFLFTDTVVFQGR